MLICCTSLCFKLSSYERVFGDLVSVSINFTVDVLPQTVTVAVIESNDTMCVPQNSFKVHPVQARPQKLHW